MRRRWLSELMDIGPKGHERYACDMDARTGTITVRPKRYCGVVRLEPCEQFSVEEWCTLAVRRLCPSSVLSGPRYDRLPSGEEVRRGLARSYKP